MTDDVIGIAKDIAIEAVRSAGRILNEKFQSNIRIEEKGEFGDVVTEADHLSETILLEAVRNRFPDQEIRSEESGWSGVSGEWLWLIDPLDGTNNYAFGLPVYGVSVTLLRHKEPVLGIIYEPILDNLYVAEKDRGATCNAQPINPKSRSESRKLTVGWIQGHLVQKQPEAMRLKGYLDERFKRVLRLWAPSLLWCMLARGDLDGIVLYNSEGDDLYAGVLMAKEAGCIVMDFEGEPFEGMKAEPYIIACHPSNRELFLNVVKHGMKEKE